MKREIEIERLVQWAYRDELPKRGISNVANSYEPVIRFGEYLTVIDDEPGFPVILGPPHPDALTIERAVQGLRDDLTIDWRSNRALLMGDLPMLAANVEDPFVIAPAGERGPAVRVTGGLATVKRDAAPPRLRAFSEVALVEQYARLGLRPKWNVGLPAPQRVHGKNNKPVLIGECRDTGRYSEGSRCPLQYTAPTIEQLVHRRAEYLIWRGALVSLTSMLLLAWTLNDHIPLKPAAPADPWFDAPQAAKPAPVGGVAEAWRTWPGAEEHQCAVRVPVPVGS